MSNFKNVPQMTKPKIDNDQKKDKLRDREKKITKYKKRRQEIQICRKKGRIEIQRQKKNKNIFISQKI